MKKNTAAAIALILILSAISGCSSNGANSTAADSNRFLYADGTYTADLEPDSYDYVAHVELSIKSDRITSVEFYEKQQNTGQLKDENYYSESYIYRKGEKYSKSWYSSAQHVVRSVKTYSSQLLEKQDIDRIDAVSGASFSYRRFVQAVKKALAIAQK